MSRSLGTNSESRDSLNYRTRCGWRPCERQMRCTEEMLIRVRPPSLPPSSASLARRVTLRQRDNALADRRRERRDARRARPVAQQAVHALVHEPLLPAPQARLALARSAHDFVGADPFAARSALATRVSGGCSDPPRSLQDGATFTSTMIPVRIRQTRMRSSQWESSTGLFRQVYPLGNADGGKWLGSRQSSKRRGTGRLGG
jgi:hypothetical protein